MGNNSHENNRIKQLTGARFIAIMLVVIHHMEFLEQYGYFGSVYSKHFHYGGYFGVDFFFVLSGFGMMLSNIRKDPSNNHSCGLRDSVSFAIKHVQKIYPLYVFTLIIGIPLFVFVGMFNFGTGFSKLIVKALASFTVDLTLLQSATGMLSFSHSLNSVCWFLSTLFCIYLVSPCIIKTIRQHMESTKKSAICLFFCLINVCIIAALFSWIENRTFFDDLVYGSPYRRVFYVVTGMLLAIIYHNQKDSVKPLRCAILEVLSVVVAVIWILFGANISGFYTYGIDLAIVSSVILLLAYGHGPFSRLFSLPEMEYLGKLSMYLFLLHYPIRKYVVTGARLLPFNSLALGIVEVLVVLLLSFVSAILADKYYGRLFDKKKS